jgi:hypothetical protein
MFLSYLDLSPGLTCSGFLVRDFTEVSINPPEMFHVTVVFGHFDESLHLGGVLACNFKMPAFSSILCAVAQFVECRYILPSELGNLDV